MARIGELLSYERVQTDAGIPISDCKVDFGDGDTATARHYGIPGDDAHPLPGDYCVCVEAGGEFIAIAFMDPKITHEAGPGERIVYSRSGPGVIAAKIHLLANGSVKVNDKVTISPDGSISTDGSVSSVGSISSDAEVTAMASGPGVKLSSHLHPTATGPTSPPTPGT